MERRGASQGQRGALTFSNQGRSEASDEATNEPTNEPRNEPTNEGGAPPSRERRVPMALAVALLLHLVSGVVVSLRLELAVIDRPTYSDGIYEMFMRWNTLGSAFSVACMALAAAGAAELVRRTSELAKRGARLIFGALLVQVAASFLF